MKFAEIAKEWESDAKIEVAELTNVTVNIPLLHNKYYKIYSKERFTYRAMEQELKRLKLDKFEFYAQGPNPETPPHWKLPPIGKILKSDVPTYVDSDPDVQDAVMKLFAQGEKVDYLENILKMIVNRGYQVKNIIDWERFKSGS